MPAITSFEIIGLSQVADNPIYYGTSGCCGVVNVKLKILPGANFPLNITTILWNDGCSSYNPMTVNGEVWANPLTTPILVNPGDVVDVQLAVCNCVSPTITFPGQLHIHYDDPIHGPATTQTSNFTFFSTTMGILPPFTDTYVNHYPCDDDPDCPPRPGFLYFTNPTVADVWVGVITGVGPKCRVDGVDVPVWPAAGMGLSFLAKAGQTYEIENYQCPEIGNVSWCVDFEICSELWSSTYGCLLITDSPVTCGPCALSCSSIEITDEHGSLFNYYPACDGSGTPLNQYSIGSKLNLAWTLQYDNNFFGGNIDFYFNPWLFGDFCNFASKYPTGIIDGSPPAGWHFKIQPIHVASGIAYPMTLVGAGANGPSQKNWSATIQVLTDMTVVVRFTFYLIEDLDNWLDTGVVPNQPKLLKNHIAAPAELTNTTLSVYNSDKSICLLAYIVDPKIQIEQSPGVTVPFECELVSSIPFTARFYNSGLYGGASTMFNPVFEFERNGTIVPGLAAYAKTKVTFRVDFISMLPIVNCVFWLIDAQDFNDTVDFQNNYDSSRANIVTNPAIAVIDNKLQSPSVGPTLVGPTTWEVSAYVAGGIAGSGQYYLIAIPQVPDGMGPPGFAESFITGPIPVTSVPGIEGCCPPAIVTNSWFDYYNQYLASCFMPTMKERIRNVMEIEPGDFGTCLENWGWDPMDFIWLNFIKKVNLNIYRRVTGYPSAGQTTYFVFESYESNKVAGVWVNSDPAIFNVGESDPALVIDYIGRVRYESDIPVPNTNVFVANTATPMNKVPAGGMAPTYVAAQNANFDWANTEIFFEYSIQYDLAFLFGGNPCFINHVLINKIKPIEFETTPPPLGSLFKPLLVQGVKGVTKTTITGQFCAKDYDYILVTMESFVAMDGRVYAFLDPYPYGVNGLIEEDPTAPMFMAQLTDPLIYSMDPTHVGIKSEWRLDVANLPVGKYQICTLFLDKKP